ncbi:MAG: SpoIVB peptidase [Clostridia bacterium]|nr:SpoIVB peptidase [Clostridia bacterium]
MSIKKKIICLLMSFAITAAIIPSGGVRPFYITSAQASAAGEKVIPGGKSIGVTLKADGVIVTALAEITDKEGNAVSPAKDAGIKIGDLIKSFNDTEIDGVDELTTLIESVGETPAKMSLMRNGKKVSAVIRPQTSKEDGKQKIGAWVKDAASGIGTITFYNPETGFFSALGHGITDADSGELIAIDGGEILNSTIVSVEKSKKGSPGELKGIFSENGDPIGKITSNSCFGISGKINSDFSIAAEAVEIASKSEICPGSACIISNVEGNQTERFDVEILRVLPEYNGSSKNMIIKITDENLLSKTGGIVQGMSGSPILKDGKLVGAVTHVFVNDPTRGYGIFIENMLTEAEKVK